MYTATMDSEGQITIPDEVLEILGLKPGDEVEFVELEGGQFAITAAAKVDERDRTSGQEREAF
jgi:AbrB family looped-hinge helix DNA binding protein